MSIRRAAVLAMALPDGARVWQAMNVDHAWTTSDYLLAAQVDATNTVAYLNSDGTEKPKPLPRPADARAEAEREQRNRERAQRALARRGIHI